MKYILIRDLIALGIAAILCGYTISIVHDNLAPRPFKDIAKKLDVSKVKGFYVQSIRVFRNNVFFMSHDHVECVYNFMLKD